MAILNAGGKVGRCRCSSSTLAGKRIRCRCSSSTLAGKRIRCRCSSSTLAGKRGAAGSHPQRWRVNGALTVLILNAGG
ncbi:hypothetical protein [Klebsiella pneumoniae]|uniref:hypothetical protein n=1 Tax=Klebsiella pneumoniae TaxID=573 RepID=UPI001BFE777E|nr:hypothetical protein [Klebsiella pneumoniae]